MEPGTPGFGQVVAAFGSTVVTADGELDRNKLAALVFRDRDARQRLEAIVHPLVAEESQRQFMAAPADAVVVYEVPLLAETGRTAEFDRVVVVDAPDEARLARLVARGLSATEAQARMSAQASREERLEIADEVIDNSGSLTGLAAEVASLWRRIGPVGRAG